MAKFKAGDKVVMEIEAVEYIGKIPSFYVLKGGIKLPMNVMDPQAGKLISMDEVLQLVDEAE